MGSGRRRREGVAVALALAACGGHARPATIASTAPRAPVACSVPPPDDVDDSLRLGQVLSVYERERDRLVACLVKTGTSKADIDVLIDGPSGRVTTVCVDRESDGVLADCVAATMRTFQYPTAAAATRYHFSMSK